MTELLIQMVAVLFTALVCGLIARKIGQPRVIGEIAGGILLGPSFFGRIAPQTFARLFPQGSFGLFEVFSTLGLVLFVFLIGSQLDIEHFSRQKKTAALASGMSILVPCVLAFVLAPSLRTRFAPQGVGSVAFLLFLCVSMSITAFPVLARILEERGMLSTRLGTTALICAAADDVGAWIVLAFGLTLIPHSEQAMGLTYRLACLFAYLIGMLGILLPFTNRYAERIRRQRSAVLSHETLVVIVLCVLTSAAATEAMGVHPLFGAFIAGICFPRIPKWQNTVRARFQTAVTVLLLPFFFVLTGMRTRLDLLSYGTIWLWTGLVVAVAVAGKMGGAVLASRWSGESWQDAFTLGALLNTRGLVELIVLNIAYDAHVFSATLFTMLIAMALITTMMTAPLLNLLGVHKSARRGGISPSLGPV